MSDQENPIHLYVDNEVDGCKCCGSWVVLWSKCGKEIQYDKFSTEEEHVTCEKCIEKMKR
jgi:hypothetical protein